MALRAVLEGCGVAVPSREVTNDMRSRVMATDDAWIRERTGIVSRYYVEPGTASSDLGAAAAREALDDAGIDGAEIDYLVRSCTCRASAPPPGRSSTRR